MASDVPNMDLAAIKNRLAEENAVLFDDRNFVRRRKVFAPEVDASGHVVSEGTKLRVLTQDGEYRTVTVGDTYTDPRGVEITVEAGQRFKRAVRVLVRQWKRIPDREREPLYEFLHKYASEKNAAGTDEAQWTTTCWIDRPMIDGEALPGFWKMLRTWESRYRMNDPNEQGVFQALMFKGPWELDAVPEGAGDGADDDAEAGECVASSPLHHTDRTIYTGSGDVPSCDHRNERGHIYEASGSFNDEDGTWQGHLDDDIARTPDKFATWSGSRYLHRKVIGGTHEWTTALPEKADLDRRLAELAKDNQYNYADDSGVPRTVTPAYRDEYGRPRAADGTAINGSPWDDYEAELARGETDHEVVAKEQSVSGQKKIDLSMMGADIETSADLDNYGLFSTREHQHTAQSRRVFVKDGGHVHDTWTYKAWKSAFLPTQKWQQGQTLSMSVDMDEDGLFNFVKQISFAHEWVAWHAKKDVDSWSVVFEFHNSKTHAAPAIAAAAAAGASALAAVYSSFERSGDRDEQGKLLDETHAIVAGDYDKNEFGLYDGRWNYIFPFLSVKASDTESIGSKGTTSCAVVYRNVADKDADPTASDGRFTLLAGRTKSRRAVPNDFGLYDISVQVNDPYPGWSRGAAKVIAHYTTRQANTHIHAQGKTYRYSAEITVSLHTSKDSAESALGSGWNDGSSVSYEGNGVWVARKVAHTYTTSANKNGYDVVL